MKLKKTKSLVASLIAIVICFSMLLGTTYAWFTDSIVNTNNIIKSGNVDVELYHKSNSDTDYSEVDGTTKLFVNAKTGDILWEPGATATETFKIENAGSLALKYAFRIKAVSKTTNANGKSLADILTLSITGGENVNQTAIFGNGIDVEANLASADFDEYTVSIYWNQKTLDENGDVIENKPFENLKLLLGIELVATQVASEFDGKGNTFDDNAQFPNVSSNVKFDELTSGEEVILETKGENAVSAKLSSALVEALKNNGIDSISLVHTDPIVENDKIVFESIEVVDKNGNVVDLEELNLTEKVTVTLPAQNTIAEGSKVAIYHEAEEVANEVSVGVDGVISYEVGHFCKVEVKEIAKLVDNQLFYKVSTADELITALEAGNNVILTNDIKIDPASMSNAYGTTGINIKNGQAIFGANHTIDIKGAGGTWDSGINTTGGLIRDLTVTGSFRGIFINHNSTHSEKVVLENVILDGTTYTISCDQGLNQGLEAINCTFKGWTSYAATLGEAKFVKCTFGKGNGYAYCRPYASSEFVDCVFESGYQIDSRAKSTFENCTIGGVALTNENLSTLVTSNTSNASVK